MMYVHFTKLFFKNQDTGALPVLHNRLADRSQLSTKHYFLPQWREPSLVASSFAMGEFVGVDTVIITSDFDA